MAWVFIVVEGKCADYIPPMEKEEVHKVFTVYNSESVCV